MNEQVLQILDHSVRFSLWAFLAIFIVSLFFIALRLKARTEGLADYFRREIDKKLEEKIAGIEPERKLHHSILLSNRLRMAVQALIISAVAALMCFLVVGFTPVSLFGNFATEDTRKTTPLRLTSLNYERFYEGFSLKGEVWNQSQESMEGLKALIHIWKSDRELLEKISVQVEPDPLPPRSPGTFSLRYSKNSPFLYGYQVTFESGEGLKIAHVKGFDVD